VGLFIHLELRIALSDKFCIFYGYNSWFLEQYP